MTVAYRVDDGRHRGAARNRGSGRSVGDRDRCSGGTGRPGDLWRGGPPRPRAPVPIVPTR